VSKPFLCESMYSPGSLLIQANGAGEKLTLSGNNGASIDGVTDGAIILLEVPSLDNAISLGDGGNIFVDAGADGNAVTTGSQVIAHGDTTFANADSNASTTMTTETNVATLDPAAPSYPTLSNVDVPGLRTTSRFNVVPDAGGTTIDSLFTNTANVDGRGISVWNLGSTPGQTLTLPNQSASGTDGGKFFSDGDTIIQPGGGAKIQFDASVGPGFWRVSTL